MKYLDERVMGEIDARAFRRRDPYPWLNPANFLTDWGYRRLLRGLPDRAQMQPVFGLRRMHGQQPHDRYALEYDEDLDVDPAWHAFVAELRGPEYRRFIARLLGRPWFRLGFHWHYTPNGCSVSPHCDARRKLGSHIFYFNTAEDWRPEWGGQTVILDDGGKLDRRSAPAFADFDRELASESLGNRSLLFARNGNSWHGVREIRCPPDALRKVFIVVIDDWVLRFTRDVAKRFAGASAAYD